MKICKLHSYLGPYDFNTLQDLHDHLVKLRETAELKAFSISGYEEGESLSIYLLTYILYPFYNRCR